MVLNTLENQKKLKKILVSGIEMSKIKENIQWYRKQKKWSQEQMATIFNTTRNKIASYETGDAKPGIELLASICKELKVYLHEFIFEDMKSFTATEKLPVVGEADASFISTKDVLIENLQQQIKDKDKIISLLEKQLNHKP